MADAASGGVNPFPRGERILAESLLLHIFDEIAWYGNAVPNLFACITGFAVLR
jgi:hypothetical protein